MAITAVRIDGRLIHGQVANLWTTKLGVTRIMVIDDQVAASDIEKAGLKLARPAGVDLSVLPERWRLTILTGAVMIPKRYSSWLNAHKSC